MPHIPIALHELVDEVWRHSCEANPNVEIRDAAASLIEKRFLCEVM